MTNNITPHDWVHDLFEFADRFSVQERVAWWLSSKGKCGKSVHDQVYPEHLNCSEWWVSKDNRTGEYDEKSCQVDSDLELEELSDRVVNVAAVFDGSEHRAEVVISEDNVRGVLCDVSS